MSVLNPYEKFLGSRDAQEVLSDTPGRLASIFTQLGTAGAEKPPAPGKWHAREIFSHLADCEITFAFRLRQTLAEENHVIQPFDQGKWAATYAAYDAPSALAVFSSVRRWNLALIKNVKPEDNTKTVMHPERGTMTFRTIVETMAGHDLNHLQQLEAIAEKVANT
jgi:DinB superfamily